jgi:hypothetical protein
VGNKAVWRRENLFSLPGMVPSSSGPQPRHFTDYTASGPLREDEKNNEKCRPHLGQDMNPALSVYGYW